MRVAQSITQGRQIGFALVLLAFVGTASAAPTQRSRAVPARQLAVAAIPKASAVLPAAVQQALSARCSRISNGNHVVAFRPERFTLFTYRGAADAGPQEREQGQLLAERADAYLITGDFNGDGASDYVIYGGEICMTARQRRMGEDDDGDYGTHGGPLSVIVFSNGTAYSAVDGLAAYFSLDPVAREGNTDVLRAIASGNDPDWRCGSIAQTSWAVRNGSFQIVARYDEKDTPVDEYACPIRQAAGSRGSSGARPRGPVNWGIQRTDNGGSFAFIARGTPIVRQFTVGCMNRGAMIIVELPGHRGAHAVLGMAAGQRQARVAVERKGTSAFWIGTLDDDALPALLLADDADNVSVTVDGVPGGSIALAGASAATSTVLAPCRAAATRAQQGTPPAPTRSTAAPPPRPVAPAAGRLPVPLGHYTSNGRCDQALFILTPDYWGDDTVGEGWAIGRPKALGSNRWQLSPAVTITVTGPRSFTVRGRTMTWCRP